MIPYEIMSTNNSAPGIAKKEKVIVIVGPTASGKTSLSLMLAHAVKGEIISADSRQVYRTLDIGTEKITREEMQGIPHHLLDCRDVTETYTAFDFAEDAARILTEIYARNNVPLIVGGSFFYLDALLQTQSFPRIPPNPTLRTELEALSTEELFRRIKALDPERAETIDANNPRRLVRALEIIDALGGVPPQTDVESPYDTYIIGLSLPFSALRERITARLKDTLGRGLVAEVQSLLQRGISEARLNEIGLEYRVILSYLNGDMTDAEIEQRLIEKVCQYAKRQRTWLKKMKNVHWYESQDHERILRDVQTFLST